MKRIIFLFFILVSSLFSAEILGKNYKEISKLVQEVCPIKNVDIDKHKDWAGYVELKDGSIVALSSSKYTFAYMLIVQKREGQDSVKNIYVTETNRTQKTPNQPQTRQNTTTSKTTKPK